MQEVGALALGGNQGEPLAAFRWALAELQARGLPTLAASSAYLTQALSPPGQGAPRAARRPFWNAVVLLPATIDPGALLVQLQALEARAGRVRGPVWGDRPLDLDLLFWGRCRRDTPQLRLPHPQIGRRAFVLLPLCEVAMDWPLAHLVTPRRLLLALDDPFAGVQQVRRRWRL